MNVIAGVCRLDGGPLDRSVVSRIGGAAQSLVSCRRESWVNGSVGLVCATVGSDGPSPVRSEASSESQRGCHLVLDGRLDNRKELIADLQRYGVGVESSDVELTLGAYEAWGDDCASRLIGDFAFGLWDGARRRLLCVRDPLGVRPLYVCVHDDVVCFASQLRQVLAAFSRTPAFDLEFVADRVVHGVDRADSECTPYRGVSRLKPGHRLIGESGRVRVERYWKWFPQGNADGRCHRDYVEQFQVTFSEAVACRMTGPGKVWSDLSGGLDSSSIVSVAVQADDKLRLPTVSVLFGESTLSDEREWSSVVAEAHGVEAHHIDGDVHHPFSRLREAVEYWEEPHAAAAFFAVHEQYGRLLAGARLPILLTGIGAEAVVLSKRQMPVHLADLLRDGRVGRFWRELDQWQRVLRMPLSNLVWRYCLRPLASRPLVDYDWAPETHDWIERSFARRWGLNGRARRAGMPSTCRDVADQWHVEAIGRITGFLLRGYLEKACDIRYPFLHRPLVELALAIPWSLKAMPGEPKSLLRRAMRGVLPERVRQRKQDASTGHAVYRGLRKEWAALEGIVASSMLVDLGVVNRARLQHALYLGRHGHAPDLGGLLSTLTLDAWLQHAAHKGGAAWHRSAA